MTTDLARLRSLRATLAEMERPGGADEDQMEGARREIGEIEDAWSDENLLAAYRRTDGKAGNVEVDALMAEITRRGLDV